MIGGSAACLMRSLLYLKMTHGNLSHVATLECVAGSLPKADGSIPIYLYGSLISYASKQLKTVAFSSCEAEYAAASYACKEIEFIRNICADMGVLLQGRLVLCVDNTAAIDVAHDVGVSARTKHFDRAIHYLRDLTQMRRILPYFVNTHRQRADGYTKALDKSTFA